MKILNISEVNTSSRIIIGSRSLPKFERCLVYLASRCNMTLKIFTQTVMIFFVASNCYAAQLGQIAVGESRGGGIAVCTSKTREDMNNCSTIKGALGRYALIMAYTDQNRGTTWSGDYSNTNARDVNNGVLNTQTIIETRLGDTNNNNAARLARSYVDPIEGHADWYLPSKNELNKMYNYANDNDLIGLVCTGREKDGVQCLEGSDDSDRLYWSSTEADNDDYSKGYAWSQSFTNNNVFIKDDGKQDIIGKKNTAAVRAIRFFDASQQEEELKIELGKNEMELSYKPSISNSISNAIGLSQ